MVDADDPSTWPPAVFEHVRILADRLRGTTDYANELSVPSDDENDFRSLLSGWLVRVYHATRLLDHEDQTIRQQGLRLLSVELVEERINAAFDHSCISEEERDQLHASHVYAIDEEKDRDGKLCFIFPASMMADPFSGINPLLGIWGGEGISMFGDTRGQTERLARLGRPSLVVATVDLSGGLPGLFVHPGALKMFMGRLLNLKGHGAEVHSRTPVPPRHIEAIWHPGDAEYDRFKDLLSS